MKKTLVFLSFIAFSLLMTGCGGPKLPEDTLVAAYVNVNQSAENLAEFVKVVFGEVSKDNRKRIEEDFEAQYEKIEEILEELDPQWVVGMLCGSQEDKPTFAMVAKCDYEAKISAFNGISFKDELLMRPDVREYKVINKEQIFLSGGTLLYAFIDGEYVICVSGSSFYNGFANGSSAKQSQLLMNRLISLYRDGEGETSDDFDGLFDIEDDVALRIQTAKAATIIKRFSADELLESYANTVGEEDLVEDVCECGSITLDLIMTDDEVGLRGKIDAGTSDLAKNVEAMINAYGFVSRIYTGVRLYDLKQNGSLDVSSLRNKVPIDIYYELKMLLDAYRNLSDDEFRDLAKLIIEPPKVSRSGPVVEVESIIDTEDAMELFVPMLEKTFNPKKHR